MNLDTPDSSSKNFLTSRERLLAIFRLIRDATPAHNAEEAANLLAHTFESHETPLYLQGKIDSPMDALRLSSMEPFRYKDSKIFVAMYDKHACFIGKDGAIDIREIEEYSTKTPKFFEENPTYAQEKMPLIFEKADSKGRRVWY